MGFRKTIFLPRRRVILNLKIMNCIKATMLKRKIKSVVYFLSFKVFFFFFFHVVNWVFITFSVFKSVTYGPSAVAALLLGTPGMARKSPAEDKENKATHCTSQLSPDFPSSLEAGRARSKWPGSWVCAASGHSLQDGPQSHAAVDGWLNSPAVGAV